MESKVSGAFSLVLLVSGLRLPAGGDYSEGRIRGGHLVRADNMFSVFGLFALILFGVYWCYEVAGRWREDLHEFRAAPELGRQAGIVIIWTRTVLIGASVVGMAFILAVLTIRELRAWRGVG